MKFLSMGNQAEISGMNLLIFGHPYTKVLQILEGWTKNLHLDQNNIEKMQMILR